MSKPKAAPAALPPTPKAEIKPAFLWYDLYPVFFLNKDCTIKDIKDLGTSMAFAIGHIEEPTDKPNVKSRRPALFKIMNNDFGYGVTEEPFSMLGIDGKGEETATMKLPKLPWQFVQKLDIFFRAVFEKFGTEGVVQLVFDMKKMNSANPGSGWDFYVPTQTNTGHECKYEKDEIVPWIHKENEAGKEYILVGSAHSHPNMSAYASSTDHKDQQDWEGFHITVGWHPGQPSHHYVELIQNGRQWNYPDVSDVFEFPPPPKLKGVDYTSVIDERVSKHVPKSYTPATGSAIATGFGSTAGAGKGGTGGTSAAGRTITHGGPTSQTPKLWLPEGSPDVRKNLIIASVSADVDECQFCGAPMTEMMGKACRCYACKSFFMLDTMTIPDIIEIRAMNQFPEAKVLDVTNPLQPIYIWRKEKNASPTGPEFEDVFELVPATAVADESAPKK